MTFTILQECPRCNKFECDFVTTHQAGWYMLKKLRCRNCNLVFDVAYSKETSTLKIIGDKKYHSIKQQPLGKEQ